MSLSFLITTTFLFANATSQFSVFACYKIAQAFDVHPFLLLNNQCRMLVCHPQESLRSSAMLLGMPCSCIRLLCQFRFVHVLTLLDSCVLCHEIIIWTKSPVVKCMSCNHMCQTPSRTLLRELFTHVHFI
jgi:hypothetical protein